MQARIPHSTNIRINDFIDALRERGDRWRERGYCDERILLSLLRELA